MTVGFTGGTAGLPHAEGRPVIMGVVNVTPDSFSDGDEWFEPQDAIEHARLLMAQGADIVDVGGESTRPGAERPSVEEELRRVLPVIEVIADEGARVSVDTMRAVVAHRALAAGASIVNDVSGGLADPGMVGVVVDAGVPFVAMHWRGHSAGMQSRAVYDDVVAEVCAELAARRDALLEAGVAADGLVLDPGLGFAKLADHNWSILARLGALRQLGHPVLVGASRKAFLGRLGVPAHGPARPPAERDAATAATSAVASLAGVWGVRVHDVPSTRDALAVVAAVRGHS
jgi:dihydropteroate synthase